MALSQRPYDDRSAQEALANRHRYRVERVAIAIYEARVHAAIINGWHAEPEALRDRFRKAAERAIEEGDRV